MRDVGNTLLYLDYILGRYGGSKVGTVVVWGSARHRGAAIALSVADVIDRNERWDGGEEHPRTTPPPQAAESPEWSRLLILQTHWSREYVSMAAYL